MKYKKIILIATSVFVLGMDVRDGDESTRAPESRSAGNASLEDFPEDFRRFRKEFERIKTMMTTDDPDEAIESALKALVEVTLYNPPLHVQNAWDDIMKERGKILQDLPSYRKYCRENAVARQIRMERLPRGNIGPMPFRALNPQILLAGSSPEHKATKAGFNEIQRMLERPDVDDQTIIDAINALQMGIPQNPRESERTFFEDARKKTYKILEALASHRELYGAVHALKQNKLPGDRFKDVIQKATQMGPEYKKLIDNLAAKQTEYCMKEIERIINAREPNEDIMPKIHFLWDFIMQSKVNEGLLPVLELLHNLPIVLGHRGAA